MSGPRGFGSTLMVHDVTIRVRQLIGQLHTLQSELALEEKAASTAAEMCGKAIRSALDAQAYIALAFRDLQPKVPQ